MSGANTKKKGKIADEVFRELQTQIMRGSYAPGDRLPPERELSTQLGTNRNTLREAVRRLEQSHLVSVRQGQGVTVSDYRRSATIEVLEAYLEHSADTAEKARTVADLMGARTWVLEYALSLAVQRCDQLDISRLRGIAQMLKHAFEIQDRETMVHGSVQWFEALIDASHSLPTRWIANPFLALNRSFIERFPFLWVLDDAFPEYLDQTLRGLETGNEQLVAEANRSYYDRIDSVVLKMLRELFGSSAPASPPKPGASG